MTPLVAAAKFHGKDGGWGPWGARYLCLRVYPQAFSCTGTYSTLEMVEKENWLQSQSEACPGAPTPPTPLPTVNAPLSLVSDTDFSKTLCRPCVLDACGMQPLLPFQGCWLQNLPRNLRKRSLLGISGG